MKNWLKLSLLLVAVVAGIGFTPGFVAFFRVDVDGDPNLAVKALREAVVACGGRIYNWGSPQPWYHVAFDANHGGADYSAGNSFNVGFKIKGVHLVVVNVDGATAGGCSPSRSKAAELRAYARLRQIVEKASKASKMNMDLAEARNADGDPRP